MLHNTLSRLINQQGRFSLSFVRFSGPQLDSAFSRQLFQQKCDASQITGESVWTIIPFIPAFAYSS
jgi:hypothetical protein